jgi:steroid 5-alpha reductase family enzyme
LTADFEFGLWFSALPLLLVAATLTWLLSLPLRNVGIVEPLWSLMVFSAGVLYALGSDPRAPRLSFTLWLCALWAARLAWHLALRNASQGEGRRHAEFRARHQPHFGFKSLYLVFWWRALAAWIVSLPLLGAFASNRTVGWLDYLGMALWAVGFVFETVADRQLRRFAADPANAGAVLERGLWRFTRHPNYFGECCLWWGFYCFALAAGAWWALPGPLLVTWMVAVSAIKGVETDSGNRRPRYADYVLKTRVFFPGTPRKSGT